MSQNSRPGDGAGEFGGISTAEGQLAVLTARGRRGFERDRNEISRNDALCEGVVGH